ncbi:hypothetical protein [Pararhodobacter zhoushanensis]|uniref:Translation initiation factor 2 n=1 Tax=Pararhodobacter zhoushanensis TaxID=2479545 RepID=A0ABT3H4L2_9RHOB|nr:hypothetical protein [Pararhodobacter zhoushanensis]MCW1934747.1 hypothetical protein [Pararhodobacter zhoushanensis]
MKPNFALKLSNDSAELLHRVPGGWSPVGSVSFDSDDIAAGCAALVAAAEKIEPGNVRTKLVIPDSEVRYEAVSAPGPTDEARRYQIEAEIERLTPYKVDELAYDWSVEDDTALVVICARETLIEAETFAEGYGFNPVAFVALPEGGQFLGEPFFGETMVAPTLLPAGAHVQPDAESIRLLKPARKPEAPVAAASAPVEAATVAPKAPAPVPAAPVAGTQRLAPATASATPATATPPGSVAKAEAPKAEAPKPAPASVDAPASPSASAGKPAAPRTKSDLSAGVGEAKSKVGNLVRRMGTRLRREQAKAEPPANPFGSTAPAKDAAAAPRPAPPPAPTLTPAATVPPVAAPKAALPTAPRPVPDSADAAPVAFASRRAAPVVTTNTPTPPPATPPGGRLAVLASNTATPGTTQRLLGNARTGLQQALSRIGTSRKAGTAPGKPEAPASRTAAAALPEPIVPASRPPANERDKVREAEAMTIFGARGMQPSGAGLARRGLMAAGGLLLLLVAVAVWALYFNGSDTTSQLAGDPAAVTTEPLPGIEAPTQVATADTGVTAPAALPDTAAAVESETAVDNALPDTSGMPETPTSTDPAALLESLVAEALDETLPTETLGQAVENASEPAAIAATDSPAPADATNATNATNAQGSPQIAAEQSSDTPQVATTATPVQRLSLPRGITVPPAAEVAFASPPPPPPFGTQFNFDERGLVEATPEGALTPSGVTVFAGRPEVVPASRSTVIAPEPAAEAAAEPAVAPQPATEPVAAAIESAIADAVGAAIEEITPTPAEPTAGAPATDAPPAEAPSAEVVYDDTPRADPALADARPRPRSERVRALGEEQQAPPEAPAADDQTLLAPPARPEAATDTAALTPAAAATIETAQVTDAETATRTETASDVTALDAASPGGVTLAALRPQRRPTDLVPEAAPEPQVDLAGATAEAVAQSPVPGARPDDITERARALLAAAAAAPRAPEVVETGAGETASSARDPVIPSSASVARQATETDAIRLNRVNLIGVFGTPQSRRALVRMSNGRVVRVAVGDRLDGGQVAAIGEAELRYVKNGRNEILRIGG